MGSKIASLRGREDETLEANQRTRSVSVGGAGSSRGPTMSAPSGGGGTSCGVLTHHPLNNDNNSFRAQRISWRRSRNSLHPAPHPSHFTPPDTTQQLALLPLLQRHVDVTRRQREVGLFWGMSNSAPNPGTRLSFSQHHTLWANNVKCPVCSKKLQGDDIEEHLVMCLSRPRVTYNEDVLEVDKGECDICFDEMELGDNIARLPCLCIYHKKCIDEWFDVNRSCPKHPVD